MTEQEWLQATDPRPMLEFLRGKASERKLRLFSVACCWRIGELLNEEGKRAVKAAEGYADGQIDADHLQATSMAAHRPVEDYYDTANLVGHGVVLTGELAAAEAVFSACRPSPNALLSGRAAEFAVL